MPAPLRDYASRSFAFACDIVRLYHAIERHVPGSIARQVLRAGTSIGANLEEAKSAHSRKDLAARFTIALREARETSYWLRLLAATALTSESQIAAPLAEANELVAIFVTISKRARGE